MNSMKENTLPDGWEVKKLKEVIVKTKNVNPKTSSFDEFTYIDISAVDKSLQEIVSPKTVQSLEAPSRAKKSIEINDILFATTRPNLKNIAIVSISYDFPIASTGFCVIRTNNETDNRYVFYYLTSDFLQEQIEPKIRGAQYPAISDKDLKGIFIPIPSLEEQKRIVAKIDTLFAKIDKAISLTEESLVQGKNLLPSVLKEVFEKGKADGWEEKKLGEIAFLKSGSTPRRSNKSYWEGGTIPWLKSGELNDSMEIKENSEFISEIALDETSVKLFTKDTLLIAMYGATAGKLGILSIDATTNQAVCSIQNKKEMFNNHFMFYFLYSIREKIISDSFGGAQPNISKTYLENLSLYIPNLSAQEELASLCDELSIKAKQTQSKLEEQLAYLKQLKSSILSKAFKGEL